MTQKITLFHLLRGGSPKSRMKTGLACKDKKEHEVFFFKFNLLPVAATGLDLVCVRFDVMS
jgi:hypothetical protein